MSKFVEKLNERYPINNNNDNPTNPTVMEAITDFVGLNPNDQKDLQTVRELVDKINNYGSERD